MPNDNSPKDRMMSPVAVVVAFANFDDAYGRGETSFRKAELVLDLMPWWPTLSMSLSRLVDRMFVSALISIKWNGSYSIYYPLPANRCTCTWRYRS